VVLALSCSSHGKWEPAAFPQKQPPIDEWSMHDEDRWMVLACENIVDADGDLRCETLERDQFNANACPGSLRKLRAAGTSFRGQLSFRTLLVLLAGAKSCKEVSASFEISMAVRYAPSSELPVTNCSRPSVLSPYQVSPEEARARHGANAVRFSDAPSSLSAPIEVCGLKGELTWLTRVTCNDGTLPWGKDVERAHSARTGSKQPQSLHRCPKETMPLDVYAVPCPEHTYEVYMDMYECAPWETF
jgi:hypothetical protein